MVMVFFMIAKGKSISHLSASINYALSREAAVVLDKNIISETPTEVTKEFKLFQGLNERCERNNLSFVLSPTISDGNELSHEQLININRTFLSKMQLTDHQYISFVHKNTKHKHIHLYANRISYEGKAYNDQYISNRSAHTAEIIAKEMGLQTAKGVQLIKQQEKQIKHPEMSSIKALAKSTLERGHGVNTVSKFITAFNEKGTAHGFRAEAYNNKQGVFQGLRFYCGKEKYKASEIDRSLSKKNLGYTLLQSLSINKGMSKDLCV
jgi:hypothetical protein